MNVLTRGRQAEEESFRAAFTELFPAAHRVAYRLLGDAVAAEDVAAEALARAFARWRRIRDLPYREAWILRVTTNLALDTLRRRRPQLPAPVSIDSEDAVVTRPALAAALSSLPDRQRQAVVLRYLHGMREEEVARALGISPGTVKTHLRRGAASLRERLGDDFMGGRLAL